MTQVIDGRVVEMKFDNSDFEKNVAQSMSTLDKLKSALNIDSAKNLESVSRASRSFDMSAVGTAVETVQAKFSAMQIVGMTAISELTKAAMHFGASMVKSVINPIKTGGMNRALNIENAKFQLQGLGVVWNDISEDINYGVKDTAYGLDSAAKAASQLAASGIEFGNAFGETGNSPMAKALRGISGVAAMTNSSFDDISSIFTTVAGQGKLMTMQLRQLESRGLNAAATLGKQLGKTEDEIREMVTKGKIDFETFSQAMDDAFGAHAKDANKTFTGAMSNVKAALSRIGANFATPFMENMRLIFVGLIDVINGINKAMSPIYEDVASIMEKVQKNVTGFLGNIVLKDAYKSIINGLRESFYALLQVVTPIKKAFKEVFPSDFVYTLRDAAKGFEAFSKKLILSEKASKNINSTFKGVFAVFDILGMAINGLVRAAAPLADVLESALGSLLGFSGGIGDYLANLRNSLKENDTFYKFFSKIGDVIAKASDLIKGGFSKISEAFADFKKNNLDTRDLSGFNDFVDNVKSRLSSLGNIGDVLSAVFSGIASVFKVVAPVFSYVGGIIKQVFGDIAESLAGAFKSGNSFATFMQLFSATMSGGLIVQIIHTLQQLTKNVNNAFGVTPVLVQLKNTFLKLQGALDAKILNTIAKSILMFAGALFVLSLIKPERLATSMIAIEVLFKNIELFMKMSAEFSKNANMFNLGALSNTIIKMGVAMVFLAAAVKIMGSLNVIQLVSGLGATLILMKAMSMYAKEMSGLDKKVKKGAGQLILMAIGIRILASSVKALGGLEPDALVKGLVGVLALIAAIGVLINKTDGKKINARTGLAIVAIAAGVKILAGAVAVLGAVPFENLIQGSIAVAALMAAMVVFINLTSESKNMLGVSIAVLATAAALSILSNSVIALGTLDYSSMEQGLIGIAVAMGVMVAALLLITTICNGGELLAASIALLALGAAISIVSGVIQALGSMEPDALMQGLIGLAAGLAIFVVALTALTLLEGPLLGLAASFLLFGVTVLAIGAGIALLSAGIAALAAVGTAGAIGLLAVTAALAVFAGAAMLLQPALVPMLALAGVLAVIGIACLATGAGIALLATGLSLISIYGTGGAIALGLISKELALLAGAMLIFSGVSVAIAISLLTLAGAFISLAISVAGINVTLLLLIATSTVTAVSMFLLGAACSFAAIGVGALAIALALLFGTLAEISPALSKMVQTVEQKFAEVKQKAAKMIDDAKAAIKEKIEDVVQLGKDFIAGFIRGLEDVPVLGGVVKAASNVASSALKAVQKTQDSHSPAKETQYLGADFSLGYGKGISSGAEDVEKASKDLVNKALNPLADGSKEAELATESFAKEQREAKQPVDDLTSSIKDQTEAKTLAQKADEERVKVTKAESLATNELNREMKAMKNNRKDFNAELKETAKAQDDVTEATTKSTKAAKEQKSFLETMKDTVKNQIDIFSKFETKTGITAKQMLENMKSNIDGVASWSKRLNDLVDRGISKELYKKLAEMGPKGYETLNAFVQMTDEELKQANELFATSLTLPDGQAAIVNAGFDKAGENAIKGLDNALEDGKDEVKKTSAEVGAAANEGLTSPEGLDEHSPSKKWFTAGENAYLGLNKGLQAGLVFLRGTAQTLARFISKDIEDGLKPSKFNEIGMNITLGLAKGMLNKDSVEALEKAASKVSKAAENSSKETLDEHSPSKVFAKIGEFATMGMAVGMLDAAYTVEKAASDVASSAVDSYTDAISGIQDYVDLNTELLLTPILDMSYLDDQLSGLSQTIGVRGQNGGNFSTEPTTQEINFTQNNYSPKALSRIDIYRQTKNQVSMMKGAAAYA